ncbi:MAG TPA: diacylglycerol kinase family protein, partial [Gaiellaceae bacterium]|nr:diacylglycerol kinase family protein [Gaiellaceae bacterium]
MQTTLIVNPYASRVTEALVAEVERVLRPARTVHTERAGHATELARELADGAVVVFSGDGGFNEVVNGLRPGIAAGFVPGGGTSVLPRALGLPRDPVEAARRIAAGRTRRIGLGRVNGRRFAFSAGVGLDAELVRRMDERGRDASGRRPSDLVFAWTAVRTLAEHRARFDPVLELVGHGRAAFALVGNCDPYSYAGRVPLRITPDARFELGLDVTAPRRLRARLLPRFVYHLVSGRGHARARDLLYGHDLDRLELRCDQPQPLQVDGEDLGD